MIKNGIYKIRFSTSFALLLFLSLIWTGCTSQPQYPEPTRVGANFVIEPSTLQLEVPQFFTYRFNGKNISFFVIRMNNGVQTFLDACASCYPHKLGYRHDDGCVTCRFCNMKFSLNKLEKGLGGCYPIKIEGRIENGKYLIPLASLEAEAGKF